MLVKNNKTCTPKKIFLLQLSFLVAVWGVVFYSGIITAVAVWGVSEIFTHCFLVLPCSLYFIYQKRQALFNADIRPNYWLLPVFIPMLVLQLFAEVGDIKLFQHIATFTALPVIIWMCIGNSAAYIIKFPLFFMLFSIPAGEQLIPFLQEITTDMAVPLLELSQVPIFRNGYYLDIPQGRFLVAEACSGISFLIASIVFGCLYAYISFSHLYKQITFVAVSIFLPILANALRVYGIVLTAYLTDMQHAAGADHLIYGGVFYSFIIFMLIIIGEKFRDKDFHVITPGVSHGSEEGSAKNYYPVYYIGGIILVAVLCQQSWKHHLEKIRVEQPSKMSINVDVLSGQNAKGTQKDWQPVYGKPAASAQGSIVNVNSTNIDYFISVHNMHSGELISAQNNLFNKDQWSILSSEKIQLSNGGEMVKLFKLVSSQGKYRFAVVWYQLNQDIFISKIRLKLMQSLDIFMGKQPVSSVMAFSVKGRSDKVRDELIKFIQTEGKLLPELIHTAPSTVIMNK